MYPDLAFIVISVALGLHAAASVAQMADRVVRLGVGFGGGGRGGRLGGGRPRCICMP